MKKSFLLFFLLMLPFALFANDKEVVMHNPSGSHYELVDLDPPVVTYDDELNELTVYFGSSSTIDLECDDGTGTPEATDDVCLGDGFVVESGATFAIKTPGKVTIDGCVFQSGARVKIEAGKVEIVKNFTAELGSAVEINKYTD